MPKYREDDENDDDHPDNPEAAVAIIAPAEAPIASAPKEQNKNDDDKKYAHAGASLRKATCASIRKTGVT